MLKTPNNFLSQVMSKGITENHVQFDLASCFLFCEWMFFNLKKIRFLIVNIPVFVFLILTQTSVAKRGSKGREVEKPKLTLTIAYDIDDIFSTVGIIIAFTVTNYCFTNKQRIWREQSQTDLFTSTWLSQSFLQYVIRNYFLYMTTLYLYSVFIFIFRYTI